MKKRIISIVLALALVIGMTVPALAAETKKTYNERVQALKDKYGITKYEKALYPQELTSKEKSKSLDGVEATLEMLGPAAVKKISQYWVKSVGQFGVQIGSNQMYTSDLGVFNSLNGMVVIGPWPTSNETKSEVKYEYGNAEDEEDILFSTSRIFLHEIAHAYDVGPLGFRGGQTIGKINGSYRESGKEYVSGRAATNEREDFADTFSFMIYCGGDKPYDGSKDSLQYKKYESVYNIMLKDFGSKSNAVKRSAAFLGKKIQATEK